MMKLCFIYEIIRKKRIVSEMAHKLILGLIDAIEEFSKELY